MAFSNDSSDSTKNLKIFLGAKYIYIYTILKASVSTVVSRHLFTNNPSQLF
jgi:hypothetical protein